jgi:hypothetical protein
MPKHTKKDKRHTVAGIFAAPPVVARRRNVVLLMLTPLLMNLAHMKTHAHSILSFPRSQLAAYASEATAPLFGRDGTEVNVEWCLYVVNFFRAHVRGCLSGAFEALGARGGPQLWPRRLGATLPEFGRVWNGTYSYLERHEVMALRALGSQSCVDRTPFIDHHVDDAYPIQVSKFWVVEGGAGCEPACWCPGWEAALQSRGRYAVNPLAPAPAPQPAQPHVFLPRKDAQWIMDGTVAFEGIGFDEEDFHASGWLNPLPPQRGVPGWQRLTMMKYFRDDHGLVDDSVLWAYEGVVLPGGQVIVGRWWSPEDVPEGSKYSGPIIMWCGDQNVSEEFRNVCFVSFPGLVFCLEGRC